MFTMPPPPVPSSVYDSLPETSEKYLIGEDTKTKIKLTWNRTDAGGDYMIPSDPSQEFYDLSWIKGRFQAPPSYQIVQRAYWRLMFVTRLERDGEVKRTDTYSKGSSTTETFSFAAELGVEGNGLSAKLSAGFSRSITIEESETVSVEYNWKNTTDHVVSFSMWQLVQEFSIETTEDTIDPNGKFFPKGSLLSDVMRGDDHGVSAYRSGIGGSSNVGWAFCKVGRYTNSMRDTSQSIYPR